MRAHRCTVVFGGCGDGCVRGDGVGVGDGDTSVSIERPPDASVRIHCCTVVFGGCGCGDACGCGDGCVCVGGVGVGVGDTAVCWVGYSLSLSSALEQAKAFLFFEEEKFFEMDPKVK